MKNKTIKVIFIILITLIIFSGNICKAASLSLRSIIDNGRNFIASGESDSTGGFSKENINELSQSIYSILQSVAVIVALIMIIVLGIKYITGSVEMKAEMKNTLLPYVIGCVVAFGAFVIWKIVVVILNGLN